MLDLYVNRKTNAFYSLMLLDINVHYYCIVHTIPLTRLTTWSKGDLCESVTCCSFMVACYSLMLLIVLNECSINLLNVNTSGLSRRSGFEGGIEQCVSYKCH